MAGRDLLGAAQTGTGKTAGFTLPLLHRLASTKGQGHRAVRALILTPTRELCAQVQESVRTYGKHVRQQSTCIYGGVGFMPQVQALRRGVDIIVATPGRLLDHIQQRTVDLKHIEILVLDEADRMLDMGFIHDMRRIVSLLPKKRQTLMFSATFSDEIRKLAGDFLIDPASVEVARRNAPIELVSQLAHPVDKDRKRDLLKHLVVTNDWRQVLVFTKTKHGANRLAEQLEKDGIQADAIHGNKSQPQRMRALKRFKDNELQVLVATDIAARGIDIDALPHVVNFDLPNVAEDYVHRIGRTGRAGLSGEAISLVCSEDRPLLSAIERLIGKRIDLQPVAGFELAHPWSSAPAKARPQAQRGQRSGAGQRNGGGNARGGYASRGAPAQGGKREDSRQDRRAAPQPGAQRRGRAADGGRNAGSGSRTGAGGGESRFANDGNRSNGARRSAPTQSWESEREAQRRHFSDAGEGPKKEAGTGKRVMDAVSNLFRKVA